MQGLAILANRDKPCFGLLHGCNPCFCKCLPMVPWFKFYKEFKPDHDP